MAPKHKKKNLPPKKQLQKRNSNKSTWIALGVIAVVVIVFGVLAGSGLFNSAPASIAPTKVLLQTTAGNITIDLRTDKPITSGNFINLVKEGKYDNTTFHRVISSFMIQGGRVNSYVAPIKDEIGTDNHNTKYTIAMAKTSQPNSATSEFFINTVDNSGVKRYAGFDDTYTVFGTVIAGQDVVDAIANAPVTENPAMNGEMSLPVNPVTIIRASIVS
ncbi:MAG: peptidylprolyl isomerase [Candidatus Bathyarchaeota archaeon]|nr:peptidylprolyl isomerase [Candidatus Bathyarchaeota archaeon]